MPPKPAEDTRPRIWADGHQHPPFEPRAFALASVYFARESLAGLLTRCATSARAFAGLVASGHWRIPEARLGRTGRFLPSVEATGRAVLGGAELLARAARVALPQLEPEAPRPLSIFDAPRSAARDTLREAPAAARVTVASPVAESEDDPDLHAIRLLMRDGPDQAPAAPTAVLPVTETESAPFAPPEQPGTRRDWLGGPLATALGYGLLVVAVPVGAVLALIAHLNGEDLRKLVDDEA